MGGRRYLPIKLFANVRINWLCSLNFFWRATWDSIAIKTSAINWIYRRRVSIASILDIGISAIIRIHRRVAGGCNFAIGTSAINRICRRIENPLLFRFVIWSQLNAVWKWNHFILHFISKLRYKLLRKGNILRSKHVKYFPLKYLA